MPSLAFQSPKAGFSDGVSPRASSSPKKRLSFGDATTSILSPLVTSFTTAIDAVVMETTQMTNQASRVPMSPVGVSICLTRLFFQQAFSSRGDIPIGKPCLLPELGALPRPKDTAIATDYPRLALRLLAPYVACSLPEDSIDVRLARRESLAECLLIESHSPALSKKKRKEMKQMACELLVPKSGNADDAVQRSMISTAIQLLGSLQMSPGQEQSSREMLHATLQCLVPTGTSIEIKRLCGMETVVRLFAPLVGVRMEGMDDVKRSSITRLAEALLHLSRVRHRLTILERHVNVRGRDEDSETPDAILGFISTAISEMSQSFTDEVCRTMPEYSKLWDRLFDHAVLIGQWRTAYSACVRNPQSDLRLESFRRMVRSMVDQGALHELLSLCTELGIRVAEASSLSSQEASETVDLYEVASEILADAVPSDPYSVRAASMEPAGLSDYQGALYALHASQKHWRRAAQSMDYRYITAQKALKNRSRMYPLNPQSAELRDGLIIEDLVLSSIASLNAIELVRDKAHKFIVSGEFGPYNKIAIEEEEEEVVKLDAARNKRSMGSIQVESQPDKIQESDRLSNFMTTVELGTRAIRSMGLRSLYFDRSTDPSAVKSAFLRNIGAAGLDIDALFESGYYHEGLLLVESWAEKRQEETGSKKPEGIDLFYDYVSYLVDSRLVPIAIGDIAIGQRPSENQVRAALADFHGEEASPYIIAPRAGSLPERKVAVMENTSTVLLRKLIARYSSAEKPLAVDAASSFLDRGSTVPKWLSIVILGASQNSTTGLFAPRQTPGGKNYLGDPSALLSLYIKRGMLAEACNTVSQVLSVRQGGGQVQYDKAASRLPEKGDIDFVPYDSIDFLWNLIEIALSKHVLAPAEIKQLMEARSRMEKSIEKHFALMQISEMGMRSARALR